MSVIKNKRSLSTTQFLTNLCLLMKEVRTWCESQGKRNDNYGLTDLFQACKNAYVCAVMANNQFPKDKESVAYRKIYFDKAVSWLHTFDCELTAMCACHPISNTKIKRWMKYVFVSRNQIEAIKKSDNKRINKKKV